MLGVVEFVLAMVCKRMQQLPTMLEPVGYRGKYTTHKAFFKNLNSTALLTDPTGSDHRIKEMFGVVDLQV